MRILSFSLLLYHPIFSLKLSYDILDGAKANSYLGNIVQDGQILSPSSDALFSTVRGEELIFVESKTGDIRTSADVDRELLCKKKDNLCRITAEVIVTPQSIFQLIELELTILDLNDHAPEFPSSSLSLQIAEDEQPGAVFRLDSAADADSREFGIESYSIEPKNGQWSNFFELFVDDYAGILVPKLKLVNPLDFEKLQKLDFTLLATDKGQLSGSMEVSIEVEDVNDHSPKFSKPRYILNISEMSHKGDLILRLKASDGDRSPKNGNLQYFYTNQVPSNLREIFLLDATTGHVTIGADHLVDYEIFDKVLLHVKATDGDKEDYATIEINVLDANDNAPQIDVTFVDGGRAAVSEDLPVGSFVAYVSVTDDDLGPAGEVSLVLEGSNHFKLVSVEGTSDRFMLTVAAPLDREIKEEYVLTLIARDNGTSAQETLKSLSIAIEDVNDNAPSFKHDVYNGEIAENNEIGDTIVQITAFDPDFGKNAEISYEISEHKNLFVIDPETADLKALVSFDAELFPDPISINIIATDNGSPRLSASTNFLLKIRNLNDNAPVFENPSSTISVKENKPIGTFITQLTATDADLNDEIKYSFKTKTSFFTIDSATGKIKTAKSIDREHDQARFDLEVIACDLNALCALSSVIVFIEDINDNPPRIIWPMSETDVIQILRNESSKDVIIGTIDVKDYDSGEAGKVNCAFEKNHKFLKISDCRIILTRDLNLHDDGLHSLRIIASDNGSPPLFTSKQMNIYVTNENLNDTALEEIMQEIVIVPEKLISFNGGSILLLAFGGAVTFVLMMIVVASIVCSRQQREKQLHLSSTPKKSPKGSSSSSPAREWRMDVMWESPHHSAGAPRSLCEPHNATDSLSYVDSGAGESLSDRLSSNAASQEEKMVDSSGLYRAPMVKKPSFRTFVDDEQIESDRKSIELFDEDHFVPSYYN
ncbi:unnamed protein product [Oikopleura dioica]|uniref:Cadherin domain-containing protein n=1 Tax=Oikopleura dioica TaxID=34765 RepID=E4YH70_OIKDI|nr:unnamed protein product [Oikopleura dioica]